MSPRFRASRAVISVSLLSTILTVACAKKAADPKVDDSCLKDPLGENLGSTGTAKAFLPDPIVSSGNANLAATSLHLDDYRKDVPLAHLGGHGVLEGDYANVVNGNYCGASYGAFDPKNNFNYSHSDYRFQEAMTYYLSDTYRAFLDTTHYLQPAGAVKIVTHCGYQDNAYFERELDRTTGEWIEFVCLGDSEATPGASYSDDGVVAVHELQHATTTDTYSKDPSVYLNPFFYDEGGSLNEAVSDFTAMMFVAPMLTLANSTADPLLFSRWALQTFIPDSDGTRGAHRCPAYDPTYPACTSFPAFSGAHNTISYQYPDGLGWPHANNFSGPAYASQAFRHYTSQEEIHNAGVLLEGALWDVYDGIRHAGDSTEEQSRVLATQLVMEGMKQLPKPTVAVQAPVNFRSFASALQTAEGLLTFTANEKTAIDAALTARGLLGGTLLGTNWSAVGPGDHGTGMRVMDDPNVLVDWLSALPVSSGAFIPQGIDTGLNGKFDPGEIAVIWFDIQNTQPTTAGAVQVTVRSLNPELVTFKDGGYNMGYISDTSTQILYGKVNGTAIVSALNDGAAGTALAANNVPTANSYFKSNPFFDRSYRTGIWVAVAKSAARGSVASFEVSATPSNSSGAPSVTTFAAQIAP